MQAEPEFVVYYITILVFLSDCIWEMSMTRPYFSHIEGPLVVIMIKRARKFTHFSQAASEDQGRVKTDI